MDTPNHSESNNENDSLRNSIEIEVEPESFYSRISRPKVVEPSRNTKEGMILDMNFVEPKNSTNSSDDQSWLSESESLVSSIISNDNTDYQKTKKSNLRNSKSTSSNIGGKDIAVSVESVEIKANEKGTSRKSVGTTTSEGSCDKDMNLYSMNSGFTATSDEASDIDSIASRDNKVMEDATLPAAENQAVKSTSGLVEISSDIESENESKNSVIEIPRRARRRKSMSKQKSNPSVAKEVEEEGKKVKNKSLNSDPCLTDDSPPSTKKKKKIRVFVKRLDVSCLDSDSIVSELSEAESERREWTKKKSDLDICLSDIESEAELMCSLQRSLATKGENKDRTKNENEDDIERKIVVDGSKDSEKINRWLEKLGKIGVGKNGSAKLSRSSSGKIYVQKAQSRSNRSLLGEDEGEDESNGDGSDLDNNSTIELNSGSTHAPISVRRPSMSNTYSEKESSLRTTNEPEDFNHRDSTIVMDGLSNRSTHTCSSQESQNTRKVSRSISDLSENPKPSILRNSEKTRAHSTAMNEEPFCDENNKIHQNRLLSSSNHNRSTSSQKPPVESSTRRIIPSQKFDRQRSRSTGPANRRLESKTSATVAAVLAEETVRWERSDRTSKAITHDGRQEPIRRTRSERSSFNDHLDISSAPINSRGPHLRRSNSRKIPLDLDAKLKQSDNGSYLPMLLNEHKDERRQTKYHVTDLDDSVGDNDTKVRLAGKSSFVREDAMDDVKTVMKPRRPSLKHLADSGEQPSFSLPTSSNPINVGKYFTSSSIMPLEVVENPGIKKQDIISLKLKGALNPRSSSRSRSKSRSRSSSTTRSSSRSKSRSRHSRRTISSKEEIEEYE